jgi:hypothetical protein
MSTHIGTVTRTLHPVGPPRLAPLREPAELVMARPRMPMELTLEALRGPLRPFIVWALFWGAKRSRLVRHIPGDQKPSAGSSPTLEGSVSSADVRPGSNRQADTRSPLGDAAARGGAMYEWVALPLSRGGRAERITRSGA